MASEKAYKEILIRILEDKTRAFGELAIVKAKHIEGLKITESGKIISIEGNPKEIIHNLLVQYEKIAGKSSTIFAKIAIHDIKSKYPDLDLPEELK